MKKKHTPQSIALEAESIFKSVIPYENGFTPNVDSYLTSVNSEGQIIIAEISWGFRIFKPNEKAWGLTVVKETENGFVHDTDNSNLFYSEKEVFDAFYALKESPETPMKAKIK